MSETEDFENDLALLGDDELRQTMRAAERLRAVDRARHDLIEFTKLMMPDVNNEDDVNATRYSVAPHHRLIAQALEKVEKGEILRLAISIPPRHGKSELATRNFPAFFVGQDPYRQVICAGYSETFARSEFGAKIRRIMQSPAYAQVFPDATLAGGSKAVDNLVLREGGNIASVGRGGATTGRGADLLLIDDPIKDAEEASSPTIRQKLWDWYTSTADTRLMPEGRVVVIQCMTGDTPVLMASGAEKPLRDVRPGDEVVTYHNGAASISTVRNWANQGPDHVFTIRMKSGAEVRANARHPFLVLENGREEWRRTDTLKKGDVIRKVIGGSGAGSFARSGDANSRPNAKGCARRTTTRPGGETGFGRLLSTLSRVGKRISGTDTELISPSTSGFSPSKEVSARYAKTRPRRGTPGRIGTENCVSTTATMEGTSAGCFVTTATSRSATEKPKRSCGPQRITFETAADEILEVVAGGVEDVFDIQVDRTENFIANGLVSHNTRWHEDDLIGRLCDPAHPEHDPKIAADWLYINVPALFEEEDSAIAKALGKKVGDALWPERYPVKRLEQIRRMSRRTFYSLYQGKPSPEDGDYFRRDWFVPYEPHELPTNLRIYAASDHAVSTKQYADSTVLGAVGVDEQDNIWILPDLVWRKMDADKTVEEIIGLAERNEPLAWWMENEMISKAFGPFLYKRMDERRVYFTISPVTPSGDKATRARSIQGRMSMRKVRFPTFASWWPAAEQQLLKFPNATHDDFVDFLSLVGLGLTQQVRASRQAEEANAPAVGSIAWVKASAKALARRKKLEQTREGW